MKTITITVYTVHELQEQYPKAFERAHQRFIDMEWNTTATWWITDTLEIVSHEAGSPFEGRPIDWDVYRGYAQYTDGPLTPEEGARIMALFPDLYGVMLRIERGRLHGDVEFAPDDEAARRAVEDADKWLRDLHGEMVLAMIAAGSELESEVNFIDTCEVNGWTFEANGDMRNV
jgi:hypothetical protein